MNNNNDGYQSSYFFKLQDPGEGIDYWCEDREKVGELQGDIVAIR